MTGPEYERGFIRGTPYDPEPADPPLVEPPSRAEPADPTPGGSAGRMSASELDEFLSSAVDRQIAEQRALRETLTDLAEAIRALEAKHGSAPSLDADELAEAMKRAVEANADAVVAEVRDLRDNFLPALQRTVDASIGVDAIAKNVVSLHEVVGTVSADIEGIAQALIDLNSGLREWARGVDRNITSVSKTLEAMRGGPLNAPDVSDPVVLDARLADQVEELDRALRGLGELPKRLEGVVSQALRRTLTARAKLDTEAETALDESLAAIDEHVERIADAAGRVTDKEESLRKVTLGQVELGSRLESFEETMLDRLENIEAERRRSDEVLAAAIDAVALGRDARAAAGLQKPLPRRRRTEAKPTRKSPSKSKRNVPRKGKGARRSAEPASRRKATAGRRTRRSASQSDPATGD